jgi:hypothetical protein
VLYTIEESGDMILFRCPACGTAHRAEPQYAGGTIPCRHCGQQVPIPHASDPACGLIYRAGEAEEGLPMTLDDIRLKLLSGELAETDLIWDSSTWKPLAQTFGEIREGGGLRVKSRVEPSADEGEIQAALLPIDAVQKVDMSEVQAERMSETKRKRFQLSRRHEADAEKKPPAAPAMPSAAGVLPAAEAPQAASAAPAQRRRRGRLYYGIQCTLLAFAIICGYKFGVGPIISNYRGLHTYVIVQSHEDIEYVATFGWRRAKEDLFKQSIVNFELEVGMPESQTLTIAPKEPGTAAVLRVSVPLRPGGTTLVNLKGKGEYGIYELQAVADKRLDTPEVKALTTEISSNRAPESAIKVSRQIRDLVAPAFKGTKTDMLFRGSVYSFDPAMLYVRERRLISDAKRRAAKKGDEKKVETAPVPVPAKPLVSFPATRAVPFANGSALHCPSDDAKVERSLLLPTTAITLNDGAPARVLPVNSPRLALSGDAKMLNLAIVMPNAAVSADGKNFTGQWDYRATCALEGKDANTWRWSWVFKGTGDTAGRRYSLDLKVEMDGKETRSIKPL